MLIYEAYWFCCLLICKDQNKEKFSRRFFYLWQNYVDNTASCSTRGTWELRGVATGGARGGHGNPVSTSQQEKVQQFQFQTSGILFFMGVQKLYWPEISRFLDNLWQLFIFSNYIREMYHFILAFLKRSDI